MIAVQSGTFNRLAYPVAGVSEGNRQPIAEYWKPIYRGDADDFPAPIHGVRGRLVGEKIQLGEEWKMDASARTTATPGATAITAKRSVSHVRRATSRQCQPMRIGKL